MAPADTSGIKETTDLVVFLLVLELTEGAALDFSAILLSRWAVGALTKSLLCSSKKMAA